MASKQQIEKASLPDHDEVLLNEDEMLKGLFEAVEDISNILKRIKIARHGKTLFEFDVKALSDAEIQRCLKESTKYHKNPAGKNLPMIEGETDWVVYKNKKIYMATTDEYRKMLWDNAAIKQKLGVFLPEDVIQGTLLAGEKNKISDTIDEISGFNVDDEVSQEEYAKN